MKGYYNEKVLEKFTAALKEAKAEVLAMIERGETPAVKLSFGNTKMGAVASVSTLPFLTCPARCATTCGAACYAAKLANLRPSVLRAYAWNTAMALLIPREYHAQISRFIAGVRFFRYHVSGDIMSDEYFGEMVKAARENSKSEILAFTKRFEIVNEWMEKNGELPANLHILFSGWDNMEPENPHGLPETTVYKDSCEIAENWTLCGGNCFECAISCGGCWGARSGEMVAFKLH